MQLAATDLSQVVEGVWGSVLGMEIQLVGEESSTPDVSPVLSACIQITGAWDGAVTLHCTPKVARHAAAVMFDMELDSISPGDMKDSLGELVNMVSGGVKSLLPTMFALFTNGRGREEFYSFRVWGLSRANVDICLPRRIGVGDAAGKGSQRMTAV